MSDDAVSLGRLACRLASLVVVAGLLVVACASTSPEVTVPDVVAPELEASSVVRVSGLACGRMSVGGGVAVGPDIVITNAHVVAGVDEVEITMVGLDEPMVATVVGFDANRDLALVEIADAVLEPVAIDATVEGGVVHLVVVSPDEPTEFREVGITRPIVATGEDIYRRSGARRRALELFGTVVSGESGSGLFASDGSLIALLFANSGGREPRSYAVAGSEIQDFLAEVEAEPSPAGPCLSRPPPAPDEPDG